MHLAPSDTMRAMPESSLTASRVTTPSHRCCSRFRSDPPISSAQHALLSAAMMFIKVQHLAQVHTLRGAQT